MLALFRNGSALTQWFIIIVLMLLPMFLLPGYDLCTREAPLSPCLSLQGNRILFKVLSAVLTLLPVLAASVLLRSAKLISFSSFLPSLIVVMIIPVLRPAGLAPDESLVLTFLFLGIHQLFRRQERGEGLQEIFLASFFFSMLTLLHQATLPLLLLPIAYLVIFRSYQWRQWVALPLGLAVPHLFVLMYYFWFDRMPELLSYYHLLFIPDPDPNVLLMGWTLPASVLLLFGFFTALFSNLSHLGEKKIHVRAQVSLLSSLLFLSLLPQLLGQVDYLFFPMLPMAWLLGLRMLDSRSRRFPSVIATLLFLSYLGSIVYHYFGQSQA
jgi:hypothetical protein